MRRTETERRRRGQPVYRHPGWIEKSILYGVFLLGILPVIGLVGLVVKPIFTGLSDAEIGHGAAVLMMAFLMVSWTALFFGAGDITIEGFSPHRTLFANIIAQVKYIPLAIFMTIMLLLWTSPFWLILLVIYTVLSALGVAPHLSIGGMGLVAAVGAAFLQWDVHQRSRKRQRQRQHLGQYTTVRRSSRLQAPQPTSSDDSSEEDS